jgi:hypothetical protein
VSIAIAATIYYLRCPEIIKNFNSFGDFQKEGRDSAYLISYSKELRDFEFTGFAADVSIDRIHPEKERHFNGVAFWQIYNFENARFPYSRSICFSLYCLGVGLIVLLLLDNFLYVVEQSSWF